MVNVDGRNKTEGMVELTAVPVGIALVVAL